MEKTVERKATEAVSGQINKAADSLTKTNPQTASTSGGVTQSGYAAQEPDNGAVDTGGICGESAASQTAGLAGLAFAMNMANSAAQNLKICPKCQQPAAADKMFCPSCGTALPAQTIGAGAACKSCGKQNLAGESFCGVCGAKLN